MTGRILSGFCVLCVVAGIAGCVGNEGAILMAPGSYGDIAVVASNDQLVGALAPFENALNQDFTFVISHEKRFNIDTFDPGRWKLCKGYKNVILVVEIPDGGPVVAALKKLVSENEFRKLSSQAASIVYLDEPYANYQFAIVAAGNDRNSILSLLRNEAVELRRTIEAKAAARIMRRYRVDGLDQAIIANLWNQDRFALEVPNVYSLNQNRPNGMNAVELMQHAPSRGLTIAWKQVPDPAAALQDHAALLAWREEIGRKLHDEDLVADTLDWTTDMIGKMNAVELQGAWSSRDASFEGGGPFWCWFVADPDGGRLFCLDALCYAPGMDKMEMMRRMRAIMQTFSLQRPGS